MTDDFYPEIDPPEEGDEAAPPLLIGRDALKQSLDDVFSNAVLETDIIGQLNDPDSPLAMLADQARQAATAALSRLLDVNLFNETEIAEARRLQGEALRYRDMVIWLLNAMTPDANDEAP